MQPLPLWFTSLFSKITMRRTYQIRSEKLCTDLQFTFSQEGSLVGFQVVEDIKLEARTVAGMLENALTLDLLMEYCRKHTLKLVEVNNDLSFATFWDKYGYKEGGSKKKAEAQWNRMPEHKRASAMAYIIKYNAFLQKHQVAKAYATTYLSQERWDNG
jgi:hypothetical protein